MEAVTKKMREEVSHQHQDISKQRQKDESATSQAELNARLKTQEYKEMLKHLK